MPKIYIVIAAYNEEGKIGEVLKDLKKKYKNIVVVDDGSKDKTYHIAKKHKVSVLRHILNRGQGAALKTGIDYALQRGADIVVTFDADGQFLVDEIEDVTKPLLDKKTDVVIGSRFLGKTVNLPLSKKIVLKMGIYVVFLLYGIKVTDSQCGFRALSKKALKRMDLKADKMEHAGEIFYEIKRNNLKYVEVPVTVIYDDYSLGKGQSWSRSIELGLRMLLNRFLK